MTRLLAARNALVSLPDDIADLMPCLTHLDAKRNAIASVPAGVGALMYLETLDVSGAFYLTLVPIRPRRRGERRFLRTFSPGARVSPPIPRSIPTHLDAFQLRF